MSVNFADLKARTRIEDVVALLGLTMTKKGDQWRGECPACKTGGPRALAVNISKSAFYCFASGGQAKGDLIALYAHIKGVDDKPAAEAIATHFKFTSGTVDNSTVSRTVPQAPQAKLGFDAEKYLAGLEPEHEHLTPLGLHPETLRAHRSGYCKGGVNRGRLALALADSKGNILGFVGMNLTDKTLAFPSNVNASDIVFGADHIQGGEVRLVRSILEVLAAYEVGEAAVCFLTDSIEPTQLERLTMMLYEKHATLIF